MNPCSKCGNVSYGDIVIHTETTFGHGDSSHVTYVKCRVCGNRSQDVWGWGWWADEDLRKAQTDWNEQNKK